MHILVLVLLLVAALFFFEFGYVWASYFIVILIIAYFVSSFLRGTLRFLGASKKGLVEMGKTEYNEMEGAKPKAPSGKEFFEKGFSRTGEGLGKAEQARAEGKPMKFRGGLFSTLGGAAENFLSGLGKLFK